MKPKQSQHIYIGMKPEEKKIPDQLSWWVGLSRDELIAEAQRRTFDSRQVLITRGWGEGYMGSQTKKDYARVDDL